MYRLRGIGGQFVILEESAYITPPVFTDVICPILIQQYCCLLALSTVSYRPNHFFSRLVKNTNKSFNVIRAQYICENCIAAGVRDPCVHNIDFIPHWNDIEAVDDIKELQGEGGADKVLTETYGLDPDFDEENTFPPERIQWFLSSKRKTLDQPVRYLFVGIDPCAGSVKKDQDRPSDVAIVSWLAGINALAGCESIPANSSSDFYGILIRHIDTILAHKYCRDATIIVNCEAGTGFVPGDTYELLRKRYPGRIEVVNSNPGKAGTIMSNDLKIRMVQMARAMLETENIGIWDSFVTIFRKPEFIWKELPEQFSRFTRTERETTTGKIYSIWSGKGDGKSLKDDLVMAFLISLYTMNTYFVRDNKNPRKWIGALQVGR